MTNIEKLKDIENRISKHLGKTSHDEWANFSRIFIDIYQKNRAELTELLVRPSLDDELSFELMQNVRPPLVKNAYTNEVLRSIFNYLSSLSSLVDVSIRLVDKYPQEQMTNYNSYKQVVIGSNINTFFGNFRNYIQHYGIPPLGWEIRLKKDQPNECTYFLSKDKLLEWEGWNTKSKQYLMSGNVNLLESINEHGLMIDDAFFALLKTSSDIHAKDIAEVNSLIEMRNEILSSMRNSKL